MLFLSLRKYLSLIRNFRGQKSTGFEKILFEKRSLYLLGHLRANNQRSGRHILKTDLIYLQKKHSDSYLAQKNFLSSGSRWEQHFVHSRSQMVAGETKLFMRASSAIFQNASLSGSRWNWRFGECPQKKSLPVVAAEKGIFRSVSRKIQKIILPKLDRIFKTNFPTTCRE